jgi:D-alanine-D-alanine ligase
MTTFPKDLFVWVLAPYVETNNENLNYYYDFTQSIEEYTKAFKELDIAWKWQQVTNDNFKWIIDRMREASPSENIVVINLCDGDDINNAPGINVIKHLKKSGLSFTGADEYFYRITTSKIKMKEVFDSKNIDTAPWKIITCENKNDPFIFEELGNPVIVKPAISGGSLGVGIHSVVKNVKELETQFLKLQEGYHGWNLADGGVIAEQFINGPEFTTLIVGNGSSPKDCKIYLPVERVFNASLPPHEKFLSFDRLWEMYEEESPIKNDEDFYNYQTPDSSLLQSICKISFEAYKAVKGKGYCRVDLRMDLQTGKLYILEVNAQCGLSDDENFTSIGAILRLSGNSFASLIVEIIKDTLTKKAVTKKKLAKQLELI